MCRLVDNPICQESGARETHKYCTIPTTRQSDPSYSKEIDDCKAIPCSSEQVSGLNCKCGYPYTGTLTFRTLTFSNLKNLTLYTSLENSWTYALKSFQLPVDSVSLSNNIKILDDYIVLNLKIFPSGKDRFNRTEISKIGFVLTNQTYKPSDDYGPFYFTGQVYNNFAGIGVLRNK